jgi:hypothetical protein
MGFHYTLRNFPKSFKQFIAAFVIVLGIGFFTGLLFIGQTESNTPKGVVENYNGNEDLAEVEVNAYHNPYTHPFPFFYFFSVGNFNLGNRNF